MSSRIFPFLENPYAHLPILALSPIFTPAKHTKQSYAAQNRKAKRNRKLAAKQPKK